MKIVQDYKDTESLRASFDRLANLVFGIGFENWYQKGFWDDSYKCHSIVQNEIVISNISTTEMNLVLNGEMKRAIQLGTVMTHPDYRNRGLSDRLMKKVIEEYENDFDFFYLFPNKSVMKFYPRYGFAEYYDVVYSVDVSATEMVSPGVTKVDIRDDTELKSFHDAVLSRKQVSSVFDTIGCTAIYMWHSMNDLQECIYRITDTNDYLVFEENDMSIHLYDVISSTGYSIQTVFELLGFDGKKDIYLHFLPEDIKEYGWKIKEQKNESMFFRPKMPNSVFSHQMMAHT